MEKSLEELQSLRNKAIDMVCIANKTIKNLGNVGIARVRVPGKDEVVTKGDLAVSNAWRRYFDNENIPIKVLTEESRDSPFEQQSNQPPKYLGVGDEIDGTFNFNRARGILPHCAIFTIFDSLNPKFSDALVTAVLEHNSGSLWNAVRGQGCFYNYQKVYTSRATNLDGNTAIMIDRGPCPSPEHVLRFFQLYQKCWPRNVSCAGVHLAGVASGSCSGWDAYTCLVQKPDELASGYLLIKEAGGYLSDVNGKPLDEENFDWNKKYQIIAAATKDLGEKIIKELLSEDQAKDLHNKLIR